MTFCATCRGNRTCPSFQRQPGVKRRGEIQKGKSTFPFWAVSAREAARSPHLKNRNILDQALTALKKPKYSRSSPTASEATEIISIQLQPCGQHITLLALPPVRCPHRQHLLHLYISALPASASPCPLSRSEFSPVCPARIAPSIAPALWCVPVRGW